MVIKLTGNGLGERQHDFNVKVSEAASNGVSFDDIKGETDIDKLFKIELASKYRKIGYIIEVLKSGDSLHISRALKCIWMYDDEFSDTISVDNLRNNVIPLMSFRMKRKLLLAISMHVQNEYRAAEFYKYCRSERLDNIAVKFLTSTNDNFKLEVIKDNSNCGLVTSIQGLRRKNLIGHSFVLAKAFIELFYENNRLPVLRDLSYLFADSSEDYLDLLEQTVKDASYGQLGARISKQIMKKHRKRVLKLPLLYVRILNPSVLVANSNPDDAKTYLKALIPEKVDSFWYENYYSTYKHIINILKDDKFAFIKQIFTTSYPGKQFEMTLEFYNQECYHLMTDEEKEKWALKQIASGNEILGNDNEYIWYKFVSFDKAFSNIKNYVNRTTDQTRRAMIINVLIESAKIHLANPTIWNRCVEKMLKYYYERHNNEAKYIKENFLDKLFQEFDVYQFDNDCWNALNKIFHSIDVYDKVQQFNGRSEFKIIALVYCIINKLDVDEALIKEVKTNVYFYRLNTNTKKLTKDQRAMVYDFLFDIYVSEIEKYRKVPYNDDIQHELRRFIHFTLDLLYYNEKTKEDIPDVVTTFLNLDSSEFKYHKLFYNGEDSKPRNLKRDLKKDAKLLVENLPMIKTHIGGAYYNLSQLQTLLKTYYPGDIAKDFLDFYDDLLKDKELFYKNARAATHGIFQLADEKFKTDFMNKYAPEEAKIDHVTADKNMLLIQQAICAHACYSRPPVALEVMLKYIKGDYVRFCLPTFQSYLATLPLPQCIEFVRALLDTPVSIQKHGIRLAFECFSIENLNTLVLDVWKETKNISLRLIIYKALYIKIIKELSNDSQDKLFDTLKSITWTVNENDDKELFELFVDDEFPSRLLSEFTRIVWKVVSQLPVKQLNLSHMNSVLHYITDNFSLINQEIIAEIVDEFIASLFTEHGPKNTSHSEIEEIIGAKWNLTVKYIIHSENETDLDKKIKLTQNLIKRCLTEPKYALKESCLSFVNNLEESGYYVDIKNFGNIDIVLRSVKKQLEETLSFEENYDNVWELELGFATRRAIVGANWDESGDTQIQMRHNALNFAKELENVIKSYIEKGMYFASILTDLTSMIINKIHKLIYKFDIYSHRDAFMILICLGLMEFDKPEIYLLVMHLLPSHCEPEYNGDFGLILEGLKKVENKEIKLNLYRKFNKLMQGVRS